MKTETKQTIWQFVKFNLVSLSTTLIQLLLANLLPIVFKGFRSTLPVRLSGIFDAQAAAAIDPSFVKDGLVTWGYVLPFFLSNLLANIYGYFMNMKTTFKAEGRKGGMALYLIVLFSLIVFSTWLQSFLTGLISRLGYPSMARTIAAMAAGTVQMAVLFPLEKFVIFKKED